MYIVIFEDGTIHKQKEITKEEYGSVEDGYLSIIDISDPNDPKEFYQDEWTSLIESQTHTQSQ